MYYESDVCVIYNQYIINDDVMIKRIGNELECQRKVSGWKLVNVVGGGLRSFTPVKIIFLCIRSRAKISCFFYVCITTVKQRKHKTDRNGIGGWIDTEPHDNSNGNDTHSL